MEQLSTDVLIVGAGPAGICCALHLARDESIGQIVLVESGHEHLRRPCPVQAGRLCLGCGGTCNVITGFGGAIHEGDGLKLSAFPSGRRLNAILGNRSLEHMESALGLLLQGIVSTEFTMAAERFEEFSLKSYPLSSLSSTQVSAMLVALYNQIATNPKITLLLQTDVVKIEEDAGIFNISLSGRRSPPQKLIRAKQVVVAVGRKGQHWWRTQVRSLGLAFTPPVPSVGLRFECPRELLQPVGEFHSDFKTTIYSGGVKVKTFCFCAGPGGGQIKFTDYGSHTLLDGHVVVEAGNGPANFALLAQLVDEQGLPRSIEWIEDNILAPYRTLRPDRPGKPVIQWYPDFKLGTLGCKTLDDLILQVGFRPSLMDYGVANIASILPKTIHEAIRSSFERLISSFHKHAVETVSANPVNHVAVIGLELEGLWDEIDVSSHMETSLRGLYACGDCSGHAQGILQAATAGVAAAEHISTYYSGRYKEPEEEYA